MPIYEYRCRKCGHVTSFLEQMNASQPHVCAKCGSTDTRKLFSTFATRSERPSSGSSCPTGTCPLQ